MTAQPREVIAVTPDLYVNASAEARYLYDAHLRGISMSVVADEISSMKGRRISTHTAEEAMNRVVSRIEALSARGPVRSPLQLFALPIISPRAVNAVAGALRSVYRPVPAVALVLGSVVAVFLSFWLAHRAGGRSATDWLAIYGVFISTGIVHEFGHAAACCRFGLRPRSIGLTAYFVMPAFYSDVSATWLLRPAQRLVVDLGGVFFQLAALGVIACVAIAIDSAMLRRAELLVMTSIAINLVPVFRFDGYWALADALAIPDLEKQSFRALGAVFTRRPTGYAPAKAAAVVAFALFNTSVWCYVTFLSVVFVVTEPRYVLSSALAQLTSGQMTFAWVWSLFLTLVFMVTAAFGVFRIAALLVRLARRRVAASKVSRAATSS